MDLQSVETPKGLQLAVRLWSQGDPSRWRAVVAVLQGQRCGEVAAAMDLHPTEPAEWTDAFLRAIKLAADDLNITPVEMTQILGALRAAVPVGAAAAGD